MASPSVPAAQLTGPSSMSSSIHKHPFRWYLLAKTLYTDIVGDMSPTADSENVKNLLQCCQWCIEGIISLSEFSELHKQWMTFCRTNKKEPSLTEQGFQALLEHNSDSDLQLMIDLLTKLHSMQCAQHSGCQEKWINVVEQLFSVLDPSSCGYLGLDEMQFFIISMVGQESSRLTPEALSRLSCAFIREMGSKSSAFPPLSSEESSSPAPHEFRQSITNSIPFLTLRRFKTWMLLTGFDSRTIRELITRVELSASRWSIVGLGVLKGPSTSIPKLWEMSVTASKQDLMEAATQPVPETPDLDLFLLSSTQSIRFTLSESDQQFKVALELYRAFISSLPEPPAALSGDAILRDASFARIHTSLNKCRRFMEQILSYSEPPSAVQTPSTLNSILASASLERLDPVVLILSVMSAAAAAPQPQPQPQPVAPAAPPSAPQEPTLYSNPQSYSIYPQYQQQQQQSQQQQPQQQQQQTPVLQSQDLFAAPSSSLSYIPPLSQQQQPQNPAFTALLLADIYIPSQAELDRMLRNAEWIDIRNDALELKQFKPLPPAVTSSGTRRLITSSSSSSSSSSSISISHSLPSTPAASASLRRSSAAVAPVSSSLPSSWAFPSVISRPESSISSPSLAPVLPPPSSSAASLPQSLDAAPSSSSVPPPIETPSIPAPAPVSVEQQARPIIEQQQQQHQEQQLLSPPSASPVVEYAANAPIPLPAAPQQSQPSEVPQWISALAQSVIQGLIQLNNNNNPQQQIQDPNLLAESIARSLAASSSAIPLGQGPTTAKQQQQQQQQRQEKQQDEFDNISDAISSFASSVSGQLGSSPSPAVVPVKLQPEAKSNSSTSNSNSNSIRNFNSMLLSQVQNVDDITPELLKTMLRSLPESSPPPSNAVPRNRPQRIPRRNDPISASNSIPSSPSRMPPNPSIVSSRSMSPLRVGLASSASSNGIGVPLTPPSRSNMSASSALNSSFLSPLSPTKAAAAITPISIVAAGGLNLRSSASSSIPSPQQMGFSSSPLEAGDNLSFADLDQSSSGGVNLARKAFVDMSPASLVAPMTRINSRPMNSAASYDSKRTTVSINQSKPKKALPTPLEAREKGWNGSLRR